MGQRYGKTPSSFVAGLNEFQRLTIDVLAMNAGARAEAEAIRKAIQARRERGY
jgi:hypothetical protein